MIGVFGNDPGGATGLAWGVFDTDGSSFESAIKSKSFSGSATITGTAHAQIREITRYWREFYLLAVTQAGLTPEKLYYVCEDFIYAPGVNYEGDSAKISTALIWGVEGYRMGQADMKRGRKIRVPPVILQSASQAKGFAIKDRLKEWDCWVVGREHERSAWQHVAYFLKRYMIQHA